MNSQKEILERQLTPVAERIRQMRRDSVATVTGLVLAFFGVALAFGMPGVLTCFVFLALAFFLIWLLQRLFVRAYPNIKEVAQSLEEENPELDSLLTTAVEQNEGEGGYLRERIVEEAVRKVIAGGWKDSASLGKADRVRQFRLGALLAVVLAALGIGLPRGGGKVSLRSPFTEAPAEGTLDVRIEPGDVSVEYGSSVAVRGIFSKEGTLPVAELVLETGGGEQSRLPMKPALGDPVLVAQVRDITEDLKYWIETDSEQSDIYRIGVFVLPALERVDVVVVTPRDGGEVEEKIKDTLRAGIVEGGRAEFAFYLNRSVASAELVQKSGERIELGGGKEITAVLEPDKTTTWHLHLTGEGGRENRKKPEVVVAVKQDLKPAIELVFPKGDLEVTPVQEVPLEVEIWDDRGVVAAGMSYRIGKVDREVLFDVGKFTTDKKNLATGMLDMEALGVGPTDMVTYHFWAEDVTTGGDRRRTTGDLYFVEVRHFEQIYREGMGGEGSPPPGAAIRQKEVITATWKVDRDSLPPDREVPVLVAGQQSMIDLVEFLKGTTTDPEILAILDESEEDMLVAVARLEDHDLKEALVAEQDAYEHLLDLQAREFTVTRGKGKGEASEAKKAQLMQLDLKEEEQRYETERFAREQQQAQRSADAELLQRLKELARRQEGVAERLRDLAGAIARAKTETEREELKRELKRLRDEQKELVADIDKLNQQMEKDENRARTAAAREKLEKVREAAQAASEKMDQGEVESAANAATRARRGLEKTAENVREQAASAFVEAMSTMREDARKLEKKEESLAEELETQAGRDGERSLENQLEAQRLASEIAGQREAFENLLDEMGQISEEAEEGEGLLSRKLYEAIREARATRAEESLDMASRLVRSGYFEEAREPEALARGAIADIREKIEAAAESVLGDEDMALRSARDLLAQLRGELEEGEGKNEKGKGEGEEQGENGERKGQLAKEGEGSGGEGNGGNEGGDQVAQGEKSGKGKQGGGGDFFENWGDGEGTSSTDDDLQGPLTGTGYGDWSGRLRDVEEMLGTQKLRQETSKIRARARDIRREFKRHGEMPREALVEAQLTEPLRRLEIAVREELAKRSAKDAPAPVDRDPVPRRYEEVVRKYYENLGSGY